MKNFRIYGNAPYNVAVLHGGPGTPGAVAPVARELAKNTGVLEPLQTKDSINGQVAELADVLKKQANIPVVLIGHSWGATLVFLFTARYPSLVKKLILVGSGPFEDKYADNMPGVWLSRLSEKERVEAINLIEVINESDKGDKDRSLARLAELVGKADTYAPLTQEKNELLEVSEEINRKISVEATSLRTSGELLEMGRKILCPVVAIHGDYDSHPWKGAREPLSRVLKNFRFILLEKCGHTPWLERFARDKFYTVLRKEIA